MCGLVGMVGKINKDEKHMFRDMLVFDTVRGQDSTGVAGVKAYGGTVITHVNGVKKESKTDPIWIEKDLGGPTNLFQYEQKNRFSIRGIVNCIPKVLIGHNRAATIGEVTVENAHPFQYNDMIGAHNGSLVFWKDLDNSESFDVDSKALINHISLHGIADAWKNFYGAAALTLYDTEEDVLHLVRNEERPLYTAESEKGDTLFWASEDWMLLVAANRNKVKLKTGATGKVIIKSLPTDEIHSFKVSATGFEALEVVPLEKKNHPRMAQWSISGGGTGSNNYKAGFDTKKSGTKVNEAAFVYEPNWKKGTTRSQLKTDGVILYNPVRLAAYDEKNHKWVDRSVIRFSLMIDFTNFGYVDVFPTNVKEFMRLSELVEGDPHNYDIFFKNKPRFLSKNKEANVEIYRCSAANIDWKKMKEEDLVFDKNPVDEDDDELVPFVGLRLVGKDTVRSALKSSMHCCAYCGTEITEEEAFDGQVEWKDHNTVLCLDCMYQTPYQWGVI